LRPGTELEEVPRGYRLSWPGGRRLLPKVRGCDLQLGERRRPCRHVASYQHPNGEPLFDLGISPAIEQTERAQGRVIDPSPIETPSPDDEEVDQATIDAVLADRGWESRRPSGAEILTAVGHGQAGRAIAYRQSQLVYESVVDSNYRSAECTLSTAGAARRFMIMELGSMLRTHKRLPKILPNRLARACTIEKGPTGFEIAWPGGQATFPIGYIAHQRAGSPRRN
jgi:hypothetical protein